MSMDFHSDAMARRTYSVRAQGAAASGIAAEVHNPRYLGVEKLEPNPLGPGNVAMP